MKGQLGFELPKGAKELIYGEEQERKEKSVSKKILRRIVWKRDKGTCKLCDTKIRAGEDWDLARNIAGGPYTEANCFVAHHTCNISQGRKSRATVNRELRPSKRKISKKQKKKRRRRERSPWEISLPKIEPIRF